MDGPYAALWRMAHAGAPLIVVIYTDPTARQEWADEIEALLGQLGPPPEHVQTAGELLDRPDVPVLVLVEPESEPDLVDQLSVMRDRLVERSAPAALFLERDGPGLTLLASREALASFLQGLVVDPEEEEQVDVEAEKQRFHEATGHSLEDWLERYRAGDLPDTLDNSLTYLRALLLETGQ